MILKDMIETLRSIEYERIEVRDEGGWEQFICEARSPALEPYMDKRVNEWFPRGGPKKDSTFTVLLQLGEEDPCKSCAYDGLDPFDDTTPCFSCRDGSHYVKKEEEDDDDLIRRQDAIDLLKFWADGYNYIEVETATALKAFEALPSVIVEGDPEVKEVKE